MFSRIKSRINKLQQNYVRWAVKDPKRLADINFNYRKNSFSSLANLHEKYAKLFRGCPGTFSSGTWIVDFCGRQITLPLTQERAWLDWDSAYSILGHDVEVKESYRNLINFYPADALKFVDIGANYGTHSLLFLCCGISSISIEPNPTCHAYFQECCRLNSVTPNLVAAALGSEEGTATLSFPETDTWLGSLKKDVVKALNNNHSLISVQVDVHPLDSFYEQLQAKQLIIKIDTEGFELEVLKGAERVLTQLRPMVFFETLNETEKTNIMEFFTNIGFSIFALPYDPKSPGNSLSYQALKASKETNFVAIYQSSRATNV